MHIESRKIIKKLIILFFSNFKTNEIHFLSCRTLNVIEYYNSGFIIYGYNKIISNNIYYQVIN